MICWLWDLSGKNDSRFSRGCVGSVSFSKNALSLLTVMNGRLSSFSFHGINFSQDMKLELLKKFKETHGHTLVSKDYVDPETKHRLGGWVDRLRQGRDKLLPHQKASLDELGFCWNAYEATWSTMYELLQSYREEFGHTKIKVSESYKGKTLGQWVGMQVRVDDDRALPMRVVNSNPLDSIYSDKPTTKGSCCRSESNNWNPLALCGVFARLIDTKIVSITIQKRGPRMETQQRSLQWMALRRR